mgnify:CR=1 FL=1
MIDLITVVHQPEMPFLELQAKSIELYFEDNFVNSIQVIVNDNDSVCDLIDKSWWGKYQDKVNIVPYSTYGYKCRIDGWENQQLCKLLAASRSQQTWTIILDAKTLFVKPCTPELMFTEDKANAKAINIFPEFVEAKESIEKLFGISLNKAVGPGGVPFMMHSDTVRDMIEYIEAKANTTFADFFQTKCRYPDLITEFYLYSGYVTFKHRSVCQLYANIQRWDCANLSDSQVDEFDRIFREMRLFKTLTVSIKAKAWPLLTTEQKLLYVRLLKFKKLIDNENYTLDKLNTVIN